MKKSNITTNKKNISIIIPVYNCQQYILKQINHLSTLNVLNIEIIFVDDCSKDQTFKILKKKLKTNNSKIFRFFKLKKNSGPGIARNLGVRKSKSEFILFLDIDDKLNISNFKKLFFFLKNNKLKDLIFFNYTNHNSQKKILNNFNKLKKYNLIKKFLRTELDMSPNFYLFRRKFLVRNKIFFRKGFYEDIDYILKVYFKSKKISFFSKNVYTKNKSINSITNTFTDKHLKDFIKSSFYKFKYFNKNIKNSNKITNIADCQYGIRGDYIFAKKILSKIKCPQLNQNYIDKKYIKIINKNFKILTLYDRQVKESLFENNEIQIL